MAPVLHVETVDLSLYSDAKSLAEAIKPALSSYGFLYLRNTGLEERSLRMFDVAERFFKTETDVEKDKVAMVSYFGQLLSSMLTIFADQQPWLHVP